MHDANLQYMIIDSLILFEEDQRIISEVDKFEINSYHNEFYKDNSKYDYEELIPEIVKQYDKIKLTQEQLDKVTILSAEACEVHFDLMPSWGGTEDIFNVKSLDGIELLKNLKKIECFTFNDIKDQSHLLRLDSLKEMSETPGLKKEIKIQLELKGVKFL